jgi:hypothetical protein
MPRWTRRLAAMVAIVKPSKEVGLFKTSDTNVSRRKCDAPVRFMKSISG